jgi:hypothetical protein
MEENEMPRKKAMDMNDPMAILARVALEEQAEKAQERANKKKSQEQALRQHEQSENEKSKSDYRRAQYCDHLLGNHGVGVTPDIRRCALNKHELSNKTVYIRCQKCRFEWRPIDREDVYYVWKGGEGTPERVRVALPNPTKMGWKEINKFFYSFRNSRDLTTRAFRMEPVEFQEGEGEPEPKPVAAA